LFSAAQPGAVAGEAHTMANKAGVWGIEIGQCAFKALRLELQSDKVVATAFDYIEHPKILSQPDADPDQLTREALSKFLERNNVRGETVIIGIPGQSGLARFVKLPPVEEKKIGDIVRFEAKQQIPFPLEEVIWDYQKIGSGLVTDGFAMETEIGLFAMKRDMIYRSLQHFVEQNVEVHVIQMSPLALCNYIAYDLLNQDGSTHAIDGDPHSTAVKDSPDKTFKRKCVVVLDIGAEGSTLVITDGDRIIWQRSIPPGGNHFTRALTKDLKLTFAKAEHLKRNATKSPDLKRILAALKPVLNEFVGEVQRSLNYFTNTHRDAHIEYMMGIGNAFRLPGLQKFLAEKLQLDVRKLQKLENSEGEVLSDPVFSNNVLTFATVYGLALQGLRKGRIQTNLLPPDIQFQRMIRAKKPWAVAAAAALLIGFAGTTLGYTLQHNAVSGKQVEEQTSRGEALVKQKETWEKTFRNKEEEAKANEDAIKNLMLGKEERLDWILLSRFVNEAMPVPAIYVEGKFKNAGNGRYVVTDAEGKEHVFNLAGNQSNFYVIAKGEPTNITNVPDDEQVVLAYQVDAGARKYWEAKTNTKEIHPKEAFGRLWSRQAGGRVGEVKAEDEGIDALIQVNLESVTAMYSTDLKSFFSQVQTKQNFQEGMPNEKHRANAPEPAKGWVIELRGYTYNRGGRQFLMDTLVANLHARAEEALKVAAKEADAAPAEPDKKDDAAAKKDDADKKDGDKKEGEEKKAKKPAVAEVEPKADTLARLVGAKVSHIILYSYNKVEDPQRGKFEVIGTSVLPELVRTSSAPWASLLEGGVAAGNAGRRGPEMAGPVHPRPGGPGVPGGKPDDHKIGGAARGEFVVLFVWAEPLRKDYSGEAPAEGAGPGGPGGPGGPMMPPPVAPPKKGP
jgi:type IV pilus assembly protein PilM